MNSNEFSPYAYLVRVMNLWWLVALTTILGGTAGFIFLQLHPPVYEATATYLVTIDLYRFPIHDIREDMLQYNEDLALNTTKAILLSAEVQKDTVDKVREMGTFIPYDDLVMNYTIERKHDIWELRYRSENPSNAQLVVNTWAEIGYTAMQAWQAAGEIPDYVIFEPPSEASLPQEPVVYDRNRIMLAGAVIGLIVSIMGTSLVSRSPKVRSAKS